MENEHYWSYKKWIRGYEIGIEIDCHCFALGIGWFDGLLGIMLGPIMLGISI